MAGNGGCLRLIGVGVVAVLRSLKRQALLEEDVRRAIEAQALHQRVSSPLPQNASGQAAQVRRYMVWGFGLGVLDGILEVYLARADSELGSVSFWIFLGLLFSAPVTLGLLRIRMSLRRFPRVDMSRGVPQLLVSIETLLWAGLITGAAMNIALLALDLLGRP